MPDGKGKNGRRRVRRACLLAAALIAAAGLIAALPETGREGDALGTSGTLRSVELDPGAGEAIDGGYRRESDRALLAALQEKQMMVTDTVSSYAAFSNGTAGTLGDWVVENVPGNQVIQQAEIHLDGRCVARSAAMHPGQHVRQVRLLEAVPEGSHVAVAYLNYFTEDTESYISKTGFRIRISVRAGEAEETDGIDSPGESRNGMEERKNGKN